ncbi:MAG: hypothetical protein U0414_41285 [Polyangiaceae bacterium]
MSRVPSKRAAVALVGVAFAALFAASSAGSSGCVALVPDPVEYIPCAGFGASCPNDLECGFLGHELYVNGKKQFACVPKSCRAGLSCEIGCNCICDECGEDFFCDNVHLLRQGESRCVPAACLKKDALEFECGDQSLGCLGC